MECTTRKELVAIFAGRGTLVQPAALERLLGQPDPEAAARLVLESLPPGHMVLTLNEVEGVLGPSSGAKADVPPQHPPTTVPKATARLPLPPETEARKETKKPAVRPARDGLHVMKDVTGASTCVGQLQDFVNYFNDRMARLKRMLRQRREMNGAVPIGTLRSRSYDREVRAIGMVTQVRRSAKGRVIAEFEDETGSIALLMPEETPGHRANVMKDEVIGVVGKLAQKGDIVWVQSLVRPDIPVSREPRRAIDPVCAAFISDIHVGSKTFLENDWRRFIGWLNSPHGYHEDYSRRIEHMVISGDVVDGIGVYPDQEEDLAIRDVYKQYQVLSELLKEVPDRIHMIMLPGNHDAVRPAEPQPTFPPEITKLFDSNMTFVGNPCHFTLEGVEVLSYHGMSLVDFISAIPNLNINNPLEIMKEMLRRRHLAPVFGDKTPLAPECRDWMVIDSVPDIFVTGHVHSAGIENYKGVLLINSSTWQSQTEYQKMMNFQPQPSKVAVVDLQSLAHRLISMSNE